MFQVVPFCGVFLKELSDALDGTASIISLKPPVDNTEYSIEVRKQSQAWATVNTPQRNKPSIKKHHTTQWKSLCFIQSVLLSVVCVGLHWSTQLPVTVWPRWSACPRERSYCQQHPPDYQVDEILLFFGYYSHPFALTWDLLVHDSTEILLFLLCRSCNRSLEVEDTDDSSTSPSSTGPPSASRNNSFRDHCRTQSVPLFIRILSCF